MPPSVSDPCHGRQRDLIERVCVRSFNLPARAGSLMNPVILAQHKLQSKMAVPGVLLGHELLFAGSPAAIAAVWPAANASTHGVLYKFSETILPRLQTLNAPGRAVRAQARLYSGQLVECVVFYSPEVSRAARGLRRECCQVGAAPRVCCAGAAPRGLLRGCGRVAATAWLLRVLLNAASLGVRPQLLPHICSSTWPQETKPPPELPTARYLSILAEGAERHRVDPGHVAWLRGQEAIPRKAPEEFVGFVVPELPDQVRHARELW